MLVVEADHPGWIQLLQLKQSGILEDVAKRYPELGLRGIVFRLSGQPVSLRGEPAKKAIEPELEPETEKEAKYHAAALDDIADPEFRALLASLKKTMQGKS